MAGRLARAIYASTRWRALRLEVLRAANYRCGKCGRWGNEVHHVVPLAKGGAAFDLDNLKVRCRRCHFLEHPRKVSTDRAAWRRYLRGDDLD